MIPRFANPHILQQSTQIVSRADLEVEHNVPHADEDDNQDDAISALEAILKRSISGMDISHMGGQETEDFERPKKQKKKESRNAKETTVHEGNTASFDEEPVGMLYLVDPL
jgi:hypothetical protein